MKVLLYKTDGSIRVLADSAMGRNRQPWFLPDFGENWAWRVADAVRISRLGKGIRPEFAERYVEERTLVWLPEAEGNPAADFMDGAAVMGDWVPVGSLTERERDSIVNASKFSTLKQGDILIQEPAADCHPIKINDKIHIELAGKPVIEFNIK